MKTQWEATPGARSNLGNRAFDIAVSSVGSLDSAPLLLMIVAAIRASSHGLSIPYQVSKNGADRAFLGTLQDLCSKGYYPGLRADPLVSHAPTAVADSLDVMYCGTLGLMHNTATFQNWFERYRGRSNVAFSFFTSGASKPQFE